MEISIRLYKELLYSRARLMCLEDCGVSDWEWYDEAMSSQDYIDSCLVIEEELKDIYLLDN